MSEPGSGGVGRGGRGAALQKFFQQHKAIPPPAAPVPGTPSVASVPVVPESGPGRSGRGFSLQRAIGTEITNVQEQGPTSILAKKPGGRGAALLAAFAENQRPAVPRVTPVPPVVHAAPVTEQQVTEITKKFTRLGATSGKDDPKNTTPLSGNFVRIRSKLDHKIYQYAVSFDPQVDNMDFRNKIIKSVEEHIGKVHRLSGFIFFLPIKLPAPAVYETQMPDGEPVQVTFKLARELEPEDVPMAFYNVIIRRVMRDLDMVQVTRYHYDPKASHAVPQHRLEVWPGYQTAINEFDGGLMLNIDVSHRVLRSETVLDLLGSITRRCDNDKAKIIDECSRTLIGTAVLTRYNNRTYRVDDICWEMTPMSTFDTPKGAMNFRDYYKKSYDLDIKCLNQPMLIHRPKKKEMRQGQLEQICLVPEITYVSGLTDELRENHIIMKDLAQFMKATPMERKRAIDTFVQRVNTNPNIRRHFEEWGLELDTKLVQYYGKTLPYEMVYFGGGVTHQTDNRCDWTREATNSPVITPVDLNCWAIVYIDRDVQTIKSFLQCYLKVAQPMGIQVAQPRLVPIKMDNNENWVRTLKQTITPSLQVVVAVFGTKRTDRYNAFKRICCMEHPIPSQGIVRKTISNEKKLRSVTQKIALQINVKLGGELWSLKIPLKQKLMVIGIDVFHNPAKRSQSVAGFVCSLNQHCTRYYTRVQFQMENQELIDALKICFIDALKRYYEINHYKPEQVIVYRDGVGEGRLQMVEDYEVPQLKSVFEHIEPNYSPKLSVVICHKRINSRMFLHLNGGRELANPPPATCVDHTITKKPEGWFDFLLVSQHVRQGTVTPTHYIVVHDESELTREQFQRLTYKLTHMYYNWPGTVRVPAPCQYAHKAAYLSGENLKAPASSLLAETLYCL